MSNSDFQKLIEEYPLEYCKFLEEIYGEGMLSEGGSAAIDAMFTGIDIQGKSALDIGSGVGGVPIYLAKHFAMSVIGIDINAVMVEEANRRIPTELKNKVSFQIYNDLTQLPFADLQFDIVYSKGVLTHVKDKLPLFKEVRRVLKKTGPFIVNDWLSRMDNQWGERLLKMSELDNLTLYAFSAATYQEILREAGFKVIAINDETANYAQYNQHLVDKLQEARYAQEFITKWGEKSWVEACSVYQLTADSMKDRELIVQTFVCI